MWHSTHLQYVLNKLYLHLWLTINKLSYFTAKEKKKKETIISILRKIKIKLYLYVSFFDFSRKLICRKNLCTIVSMIFDQIKSSIFFFLIYFSTEFLLSSKNNRYLKFHLVNHLFAKDAKDIACKYFILFILWKNKLNLNLMNELLCIYFIKIINKLSVRENVENNIVCI